MTAFLAWYLLLTLLGWLTFPLAWRLFPALADRGYSLSRVLGLLLWGFVFWLLVSLGILQNDGAGLGFSFVLLLGLSGWILWKSIANRKSEIIHWLKSNRRFVIAAEVLFFLAFAAWAFVRACNPEITSAGGEKTMELAFINAILRSPSFPPHDPWLSGYAISYYYFGYVMTAMLARATGAAGSVAHNLMLALIFALSASGAYGILYNLLAVWRKAKDKDRANDASAEAHPLLGLPLLGPFFLLIVSNFEGFLEALHQRGLFWPSRPDSWNFWIWLDIKFLDQAPAASGWIPSRFWWWWQASRVIRDTDLAGAVTEIIDEFPFFSYLLGDLHPHVLAMPFGLLAAALALNLYLGGWDSENRLRLPWRGLFCAALVLGGLAFLNTWDILPFTALTLGAFLLRRVRLDGWTWARLEELVVFAVPLGALSLLLYLPFYFGFSSQAGGVLPNLVSPTRGAHLWVMFGPLFVPLFAWLAVLLCSKGARPRWRLGFSIAGAIVLFLWAFSWLLGWFAWLRLPEAAAAYLASQGVAAPGEFFLRAGWERLNAIGGLLTLFLLLALPLAWLLRAEDARRAEERPAAPSPSSFVALLILLAALLVLAPEFLYLRDNFGSRMNTVFKFYYQGWELWSLAAAFGVAVLLKKARAWRPAFLFLLLSFLLAFAALIAQSGLLRLAAASLAALLLAVVVGLTWRAWRGMLFHLGLACLLAMALTYPVLALPSKTNDFQIPAFLLRVEAARQEGDPAPLLSAARVWTLDGAVQFERQYPADARAVRWLQSAPLGVVAEAVGAGALSYQDYAHISTYSGLPTVLGWAGHEGQWRGSYEGYAEREQDIRRLYETRFWDEARAILEKYRIRYVYVGTLERSLYRVSEAKFQQFLLTAYESGGVTIYAVP